MFRVVLFYFVASNIKNSCLVACIKNAHDFHFKSDSVPNSIGTVVLCTV